MFSFRKRSAYAGLGIAMGICLLILVLQPKLQFDYEFESLFPQDNPEMAFFNSYRDRFGNDNDYLLFALKHEGGIFDSVFLNKAFILQNDLAALSGIQSVVSLLDLEEPIINPFGIQYKKALDINQPALSIKKITDDPQLRHLVSEDGEFLLFVIQHTQKIGKEEGDMLFEKVMGVIKNSGFTEYRIAGKIKAQGAFVKLMQEEFSFFMMLSLLLIVVILLLVFQSWWGVLLPVVVLAMGIGWTVALILLTGQALDVMSVMQPTILGVIGLAALVHYLNHYLHLLRQGYEKEKAVQQTFKDLFLAVFLTCMTTSFGFFSLYFTSVPNLKSFGLYTGAGVLLIFVAVNLISPGLLYLFPPVKAAGQVNQARRWRNGLRTSLLLTFRFKKVVVGMFFLLTLGSVIALTGLKIDGYILDNLPDEHELVQDFVFFDQYFGGSKPLEMFLEAGEESEGLFDLRSLKEIEKLEKFVEDRYNSSVILSPLTIVKAVNKAQNGGNPNAFRLPSSGQLSRIKALLPNLPANQLSQLLSEDYQTGRLTARTEDMGSWEGSQLKADLDLFLHNEIDPDYLKARLTGTSLLIDLSHETVTLELAKGLGLAFLLVAVIAGLFFKSFRIAFMILLPNIIPLLWMCGLMWVLGIDLKLTTAILFTVAFGIAVDDSIHFMAKLNTELSKGKSLLYAVKRTYLETGKAILLSTLILVSGFSVLIFSKFGVTYYAGVLVSSALIFALLADMLLLPILLLPMQKIWKNKFILRKGHF
jgi:uncharacterized protein